MARQEKHPDWNSIRQGRERQSILAKELHQKAGVPEGLCGLSEVATFQQVIQDYQIVVLSSDHFTAIVYEGPRREKQIYWYHHDNHFDVITSVSSFLGKGYWCLECKRGYDKKEGIAVTRYANAVSLKNVGELLRKQDGESADNVRECLLVMIAIPIIHDPTEQTSLFVKSIINARHATKSCLTGKEVPMHTCVEKLCVGTVKNMLFLIHICVTWNLS